MRKAYHHNYSLITAPPCHSCGEESTIQCESCGPLSQQQFTHYCQRCSDLYHSNPSYKDRAIHMLTVTVAIAMDDPGLAELNLLSVICIETSHYVCFTRDPRMRFRRNGSSLTAWQTSNVSQPALMMSSLFVCRRSSTTVRLTLMFAESAFHKICL